MAIIRKKRAAREMTLSIFSFTSRGFSLSHKLSALFSHVEEIGPDALKGGKLKGKIKTLFERSRDRGTENGAIIFISATGIAVRSIAPFIIDKTTDPAVIVIDEHGRFVISLLSGHLGGANKLAKLIASKLKAREVITTATDLAGLPCVEDIALKFSLEIENQAAIKKINSAILRAEKLCVIDPNPARRAVMKADKKLAKSFTIKSRTTKETDSPMIVVSSESLTKLKKEYKGCKNILILRPQEFVVGIGCRRGVRIKEIEDAYNQVLTKHNISPLSIHNLASIDIKADERGLLGFAMKIGLKIDFIDAKKIRSIRPPSGISKTVERLVGVAGVAEPSALLSAGTKKEKAKIWIKKQKFPRVTIAIARAPYTS